MIGTIKTLQKQIVANLEDGRDISELSRQLATERAKIASQAEVEELQKVADARQALRNRAENVKATVTRQAAAVDEFLAHRDKLLPQLQELIGPMRELARMGKTAWDDKDGKPGECYIYNDPGSFQAAVRGIPKELLADFKCPTLEMAIPSEDSFGKSSEALYYLEACAGILANFRKGFMAPFAASTDEGLLLDNEPETETGNCIVCSHPEAEAINKQLREGKPLRDIETEFNVSRSTLSRHKNKCLKLIAIQIAEPESPAASSNQTFFHG